jgi:tetratricopeptide (TPR) repeat protein
VRLSAALIVRDEERHLGACLAAIQPLVDEIVVVDTGSIDRSVEIAARHGARVFEVPWREDFARARNVALDHAGGDWILYIDADERATATGDLRAALQSPDLVAARVPFRASIRLTPYLEHRLFRNRPEIRFRGAIHETLVPAIRELVEHEGLRVGDAPLAIEHLGYEGDLRAKHRRNLPLLRRAVEENPRRIYLWEAELALGDGHAAREAWDRGLEIARSMPPLAAEARLLARRVDLALDEGHDPGELLARAEARYANDPLVLWATARRLVEERRYAEAQRRLERLLTFGPDGPPPGELGYDLGLFRELQAAAGRACGGRRSLATSGGLRSPRRRDPAQARARRGALRARSQNSRPSDGTVRAPPPDTNFRRITSNSSRVMTRVSPAAIGSNAAALGANGNVQIAGPK